MSGPITLFIVNNALDKIQIPRRGAWEKHSWQNPYPGSTISSLDTDGCGKKTEAEEDKSLD